MDAQKIVGIFVAIVGGGFWLLVLAGKLPVPALFKSGLAKKALPSLGPLLIGFGVLLMLERKSPPKVDLDIIVSGIKAKLKLPVAVDADTRLDDIRPSDGALGYYLTLTNASGVDRELGKRLESQARGTACANPQYKTLFDSGVSIRVVYNAPSGDNVANILLTPTECKKSLF